MSQHSSGGFLDEVVDGKDQIYGSKNIKAGHEKDKAEHKEMSYQIMDESQIIEYIKKIDKDLKSEL